MLLTNKNCENAEIVDTILLVLEISSEELRALGHAALERVVGYYESLRDRPVVRPTTSAELRGLVDSRLPEEGASFDTILQTVESFVERYSRHSAHPRFFGYISSPGTPVNAIGAMIEAALSVNVTCWRSAPAGTEIEHVTMGWLKQMIGMPEESVGLFVSGGSMANFAALAAARSAKAPGNVVRDGIGAQRMCVYVSPDGHYSIRKAAGMLGIGECNVREVAFNDLERAVDEDTARGYLPFCIVASAGTTGTGAIDPLPELADFARDRGLWLHVDAAYGGFAMLAPSARPWFAGIERADSVALDPHKWLYLPPGCGCVLYRDPAAARAAFSHEADYTRPIGLGQDETFAFWDYGPELSRPFRAFDLWLLMQYVGARPLGEAIEHNMACARHFAKLVEASVDFEMLAPVGLSVFCFRYAPRGFSGDLDALNERILVALQRAGSSYVSNTRVNGKFALRGCVLNYRTTQRDMEILMEDIRRAAALVSTV